MDISEHGTFASTTARPIPPLQTGSYQLAICVTPNNELFPHFSESGTFTITTTTGTLAGSMSGEDLGCEGPYHEEFTVATGTRALARTTGGVAMLGNRTDRSVNQFLVGSYDATATWTITLTR